MIDDFANSWHLTNWDWLAFAIAILSFVVASVSLIVAVRTLRSQRQTERNTTPIMNPEIQQFLVDELFDRLFDGYIGLHALRESLAKVGFDAYPPGDELMDFALRVDDIHCELYYNDPVKYRMFQGFREQMENYNRRLVAFGRNLGNPSLSAQYLKQDLIDLLQRNVVMAGRWMMLVKSMFGYEVRDIYIITAGIVDIMKKADVTPDTRLLFDKDDFYVKAFFDASVHDLLCAYMTGYAQEVIAGFDKCLIPLKRG